MKRIPAVIALLFTFCLLRAQAISDQEREFVIRLLETNSESFLASIETVSENQWKFKPSAEGWSVGEIAEHITLAEDLLFSITQKALHAPADLNKAQSLGGREQFILEKISDRSTKAVSPEVIRPVGKFLNKKDLISAFQVSRAKTINYLTTTTDALKSHVALHPFIGEMTVYQWFVFVAGHADRHVAQMTEIKLNDKYPRL